MDTAEPPDRGASSSSKLGEPHHDRDDGSSLDDLQRTEGEQADLLKHSVENGSSVNGNGNGKHILSEETDGYELSDAEQSRYVTLSESGYSDESLSDDNAVNSTFSHHMTAAINAVVANFVIAALKFFAWATYPSAALFSEGLHSFGDGVNGLILIVGLVRGNRSPDDKHHFGYGLETNLWALLASFVLFFSASWAFVQGFQRFSEPHGSADSFISLVVLALSMVFEIFAIWSASRAILAEVGVSANLFMVIPKGIMHVNEARVPTTRYVFFEDVLAFMGAAIAFFAIWGSSYLVQNGWLAEEYAHYPDAIASIVIALMLLMLSITLFVQNKSILMAAAAPAKVEQEIVRTVLGIHGVSQVHSIKTVDQGHSGLIINVTVEVEPDTQVKDVDDLTDHIKDKLCDKFRNVRHEQIFIEVLADETEIEWCNRFELLIEEGRKEGVLKPRDEALLRRAYDFTELVVRDVMVPRRDVNYVNIDTSLEQLAENMIESGHTRYPVFRDGVDNLMGIIHSRDVFMQWRLGETDIPLSDLIRSIDIYPENKPVSDLLEEFKRKKLRMAAVADEHGGFSGIVTIEDLMEEIVGEIWDEHEEEELMLQFLSPYRVLVSGKYNIEDINEALDLSFPVDEFLTIGGFVFGMLGREPQESDRITFEDMTLTVDQVDGPRIVTITIESPQVLKDCRPQSEKEKEQS